jgi:hypothetical protein
MRSGKAGGTCARRCAGAHRTSSPPANAAGAHQGLPNDPGYTNNVIAASEA